MEVEDGEDGASAGRVEGGTDAPAAHARPSENAAAPARPASADAIKEMMLALERGHQALGGVSGGGSTDDAAGSGSEGQQGSGTHLAPGQVAVAGDGALVFCILYSVICLRGNGVLRRTRKVIQGDDNGHVGRPCQVSPAPPCPELFCELRGLCRLSYFGPRTCGRSEKPSSSKWRGLNPGFQRNPSPP
jgi:hypothetical protein